MGRSLGGLWSLERPPLTRLGHGRPGYGLSALTRAPGLPASMDRWLEGEDGLASGFALAHCTPPVAGRRHQQQRSACTFNTEVSSFPVSEPSGDGVS